MTTVTLFGFQGSGSAAIEVALGRAVSFGRRCKLGAALGACRAGAGQPAEADPDSRAARWRGAHRERRHPHPPGAGAPGLLPADAGLRAQAIRGLVYIAANCYSAISIVDYPERWVVEADDSIKERVRRGARGRLHYHWELFADMVAGPSLFSAQAPGGLEILAAVVSKWSGTRAHLRTVRPAFLAQLEGIETQPSVAPVFARHWPA